MSDAFEIDKLIQQLHHRFAFKDLGKLNIFLGIKAQFTSFSIFLSQKKVYRGPLHESQEPKWIGEKPFLTPMVSVFQLTMLVISFLILNYVAALLVVYNMLLLLDHKLHFLLIKSIDTCIYQEIPIGRL